MKKLTYILSITAAAFMLSGCLIVGTDEIPEIVIEKTTTTVVESTPETPSNPAPAPVAKHSITCKNQTSITITDWCVKKDNIVTYANSGLNRSIRPGSEDMITNLPEGYYKVYFSFEDTYQLQPGDYYSSESIYLNKDVSYCLYERPVVVDCRSASGNDNGIELYLSGSDGSEIKLTNK